jgi:hypothetical protein
MEHLDPLLLPLSGFNLIEASAGTGKTYTITALVRCGWWSRPPFRSIAFWW